MDAGETLQSRDLIASVLFGLTDIPIIRLLLVCSRFDLRLVSEAFGPKGKACGIPVRMLDSRGQVREGTSWQLERMRGCRIRLAAPAS